MAEVGDGETVNLRIANRLWPHRGYPFLRPFCDICQEYYGAAITPVNYEEPEDARQTINNWVRDESGEKIRELIPAGVLDALTRLVLANAVYFKGNWARCFDREKTENTPVWTSSGTTVNAPLMQAQARFP